MKKFILWLIKVTKVDIKTIVYKDKVVEKIVYKTISDDGIIKGDVTIEGNITVLGTLTGENVTCLKK